MKPSALQITHYPLCFWHSYREAILNIGSPIFFFIFRPWATEEMVNKSSTFPMQEFCQAEVS